MGCTEVMLLWLLVLMATHIAPAASAASCPMDMSYVRTLPWDYTSCLPDTGSSNLTFCCQTLLSLLGVAISQRLRDTSLFRLPDSPTSAACLAALQSNLSYPPLSLPAATVPTCFPSPDRFVIRNDTCAGVMSRKDWVQRLGNSTALDQECEGDLSGALCRGCVDAGLTVASDLTRIDGNASHATECFYLAVVYGAGVANGFGPKDVRTAGCVFGLPLLSSPVNGSGGHRRSRSAVVFASTGAAVGAIVLLGLLGIYLWLARRRKGRTLDVMFLDGARDPKPGRSPRPNTGSIWYTIRDLKRATGNFSDKNLIGQGGFGVVYRGVLPDGTAVAVKRIVLVEDSDFDEFRNEVSIISNLRHRNLVPLRGCCIAAAGEGEEVHGAVTYLVYDYMPNGSLHEHLFGGKGKLRQLTWPERKGVVLDVARGISYLHDGVKPAIFHRDIKATNILLDEEMRARVADFGLARQSREGMSHLTTRVAGTHGYLAPEYALYGQLTGKSDVYSFGVVVLEVMSGRRVLEMSEADTTLLITDWAWGMVKAGRGREVLDKSLVNGGGGGDDGEELAIMERFVMVGVLCAHVMVALRPTIADAVRMLEGDMDVPVIPDRPLPLGDGSVYTDGYTFSV